MKIIRWRRHNVQPDAHTEQVWTDESHGSVMVAECSGINRHENARLISAAPELLEALKTLLEASRELDQSATHDGLNNCKAITQARAAIRKAEEGGL